MSGIRANKQVEDAIFYAATSMPASQELVRFLEQACAGDVELRAAVEEMLEAHNEAETFFAKGREALSLPSEGIEALPSADYAAEPDADIDEQCGARVGRYKLLQRIGEGGCGVVYMAEQEEPVRRRVALKIIKLGMDTKSVIARFDAERQALAMMDHPNIARVLDGGATDTGRPYFVMELVRGFRITEYCDKNKLDTRGRLELFIPVCNAIQHAHQKGVIHRDIKPSNILVTMHDGKPVPKVIDFGIAKAMQGKLTDKTLFTAYEQLIGTPAYMSPEQAEMSGLDVDTRSDIYSLGVLLYELLTSKTPFKQEELLKSGLHEMRRKLREDEPQRPSEILTTLQGTELRATAEYRHIEPPRLMALLKGDLDWIVLKALEKDRTRRYETANALALDVEHYLNNDIVSARPPSRVYRFKKLVLRNRAVFVSSAAVALALLIGLGAATLMFFRERVAREQAEQAEKRETELRQQAEAKEQINQAAVYVSRNRFEDANEVLNQVKILPKQPSFDGVLAYRRVGEWLALQQRWADAANRFWPLMEIDRLDTWQVVTLDYQACGVVLAECGYREQYSQFCKAAADRFQRTPNGDMAGRVLKTCLLFPPDPSMMEKLAPMASVADRGYRPIAPDKFPIWPTLHLALWEYRSGNFDAANGWCKLGIERGSYVTSLRASLEIIQAMSSFRQGQTNAARQLAYPREALESRFKSGLLPGDAQGFWYDWLFARILLREATAAIETKAAAKPEAP
jgi:eukaryotic-like serine/threonine-protein kinase